MHKLAIALILTAAPAAASYGAESLATPGAGEAGAAPVSTPAPAATPIALGMPIDQALDLLGEAPDHTTEIGAACGVLEVSTWEARKLRIISVGGIVSSISTE